MNLFEYFEQEMNTDDVSYEKKSAELKEMYENASLEQSKVLNEVFITLCGWSLGTLIQQVNKAGEELKVMENEKVICRDCLGEVEESNGNFELELCNSCNQIMIENEGV